MQSITCPAAEDLEVLPAARWLYVDAHVLVVDKPAGMLCVPGRREPDCLLRRIHLTHADAQVVHRLDMATSGVMVFARSAAAQRRLSMAFAARQVHKRYVAVVHGLIAADAGRVELPLIADWPRRPLQKVDHAVGKPSVTDWRVLSRDASAGTTRIELCPLTGRTHQLRVHLQQIGHPIVGDPLYGRAEDGGRLLLHATWLALQHPDDGRAVEWHGAVPF